MNSFGASPGEFGVGSTPKPDQWPGGYQAVPHPTGYQGGATAPPISSLISIFTHPFSSPNVGTPGMPPNPTQAHPPPQIPGGTPGPVGGPAYPPMFGPERYRQYQQVQNRVPSQYQGMLPRLPGWAGYLQWLNGLGRT